jgi:hypothetical protein
MHGGTSTGPRTKEGMARMIAALTKHGMHGAAGAPQRAEQRHIRTLLVRYRLVAAASRLQAYLPPEMAARLALGPKELAALKHPSQVAFEMRQAATSRTVKAATSGTVKAGAKGRKRSAGTRRATADAGVVLRARETERQAVRAEAAACAPWRAAIAFARAAKRAARGAAPRPGNRPTRTARSYAMQRESAVRAPGLPTGGAAAPRTGPTAPGPAPAVRRNTPGDRHAAASALRPAAPGQHAGGKPGAALARVSPTLAGAGSVLAAPRGFRTLPLQPVSAAARKLLGTTMSFASIPQWHEKRGPGLVRLTPTKAGAALGTASERTGGYEGTRATLDALFGPVARPGWHVLQAPPVGMVSERIGGWPQQRPAP